MKDIEAHWKSAFSESAVLFEEDHEIARWSKHGLNRRVQALERLVAEFFPDPQDSLVLDAGCGPATLALKLADRGFKIIGVDYSQEMIAKAVVKVNSSQVNKSRVNFCVAEVQKLPVASGTVDLLTCVGVFQHVGDTHTILREFHRVLKPSAVCIVNAPNMRFLMRKRISYYKWYDPNHLKMEAEQVGFEGVEVQSFVLLPRLLRTLEELDRLSWLNSVLWPFAHDLVLIARKGTSS